MGFSRQEYWSGLPFPPPEDRTQVSYISLLHWQVGSLPISATWEARYKVVGSFYGFLTVFKGYVSYQIMNDIRIHLGFSCLGVCSQMLHIRMRKIH